MKNTWIVEVARSRDVFSENLRWEPAAATAEACTFPNDQRKLADMLAATLAARIGDRVIVRCRGTARNRGSFYPNPRPARISFP